MNTNLAIFNPRAGMRFEMRNCAFEVCFAGYGMVRYATSKGGQPCRITAKQFKALQEAGEITIKNPELNRQDQVDGSPSIPNMSDDELTSYLRRERYASAALAELTHPNSKRALETWIPSFAETIGDTSPPKPRTVSGWVNTLLVKGREALGATERKRGNRSPKFSPEIELLILEAIDGFLQDEEQRDGKDVLTYIVGHLAEQNLLTKDEAKIAIPSERTIRRIIKRLDPYLLVRIKKGRLAAERMARAAGKSIISPRPLHLVQIDTHFLKVFVVDPDSGEVLGNPYLTCAFDVHTECVVGMYVNMLPASTATTLGAMKDMLTRPENGLPGGIPTILVPDNGIEFRNSGVERLVSKLKIYFEPAAVRDPNGKGNVESFFRTLSLFLIQKIKGTTFSGPENRGDYPSENKAYATVAQIEEYVRDWVEHEYHQRPHSSTRRVPIRQWEEETARGKPMSLDLETVNAIARRPFSVRIRKGRVGFIRLNYFSHALKTVEASYGGRVTVLVDELDLSSVLVEHPYEKGVLIQADSTDPEYTNGLTLWEHREAMKILDAQTAEDIKAVGKYTPLLARWKLLQRFQKDPTLARKKLAKLTQGKGRITQAHAVTVDIERESARADDSTKVEVDTAGRAPADPGNEEATNPSTLPTIFRME